MGVIQPQGILPEGSRFSELMKQGLGKKRKTEFHEKAGLNEHFMKRFWQGKGEPPSDAQITEWFTAMGAKNLIEEAIETAEAWRLAYFRNKYPERPEFSLLVSARRLALGLDQDELAGLSDFSRSAIQRWEGGIHPPEPENAEILIAYLYPRTGPGDTKNDAKRTEMLVKAKEWHKSFMDVTSPGKLEKEAATNTRQVQFNKVCADDKGAKAVFLGEIQELLRKAMEEGWRSERLIKETIALTGHSQIEFGGMADIGQSNLTNLLSIQPVDTDHRKKRFPTGKSIYVKKICNALRLHNLGIDEAYREAIDELNAMIVPEPRSRDEIFDEQFAPELHPKNFNEAIRKWIKEHVGRFRTFSSEMEFEREAGLPTGFMSYCTRVLKGSIDDAKLVFIGRALGCDDAEIEKLRIIGFGLRGSGKTVVELVTEWESEVVPPNPLTMVRILEDALGIAPTDKEKTDKIIPRRADNIAGALCAHSDDLLDRMTSLFKKSFDAHSQIETEGVKKTKTPDPARKISRQKPGKLGTEESGRF